MALGLPLDVALARKIGAPSNPELAVGAVGEGRAPLREADGRPAGYIVGKSHYLDTAVEMGLGADRAHVDLRTTLLG